MTETWKRLAARIDALNLRERVFVFLAVIVVCIALVDAVWVGPSRMKHQQVRQQFDAQAAELRQLQDELRRGCKSISAPTCPAPPKWQ